ncbi:helix-turn-helix domain-containing protein [Rhizobiales bacterium RZME27]|uniref:Helix-turn-helix domain-containing protein n=1 Tax=Endobacterium cereale TaxID=2663029 RepID=A0A6A8A624_9HYPH|nr:AraC family transcriptional regulator [Endobacterium cereale]MEB2844799.1 AraC family transcriptional regulator [Endobacterium cereale]MQY44716.1 helix-turn-helix domain-containing protein [Endobacterium cereale]
MLTIPLPFFAGLVFVLTLHLSLKGVALPGTRKIFNVFLALYAAQGIGIGLRFGYGVESLVPLLPVTAACMPPLAYLAFRSLTAMPVERFWVHILPPLAVAISVAFARQFVDLLLFLIFVGYSVALWRITRAGGDEVMAEAALQRMRPAFRAARLTAALMLFFAVSDGALAVYAEFYGNAEVPLAVSVMNLAAIVAVIAYYLWPEMPTSLPRSREERVPDASPEDEAILTLVSAALETLFADENLSLARLARKASLPARDVSAAINRASGLNVSQFVNNRRVAEACRLLDETGKSATTILFEVGFSTKSNFNREFRRVTAKSPRQWKARDRNTSALSGYGVDLVAGTQQVGNIQQS